jgi:long-chain acyl-CoA synthetase
MPKGNKPWIAYYDKDVPAEIDIPDLSLVDLFNLAVDQFPDKICAVDSDRAFSYKEIDEMSSRVARFLMDKNIQKGDRVGILLPNNLEFVISYYGILKAGGVVLALNPASRPPEIEIIAKESGVKVLILPQTIHIAIKHIQKNTDIESCVVIGGELDQLPPPEITWDSLMERYQKGGSVKIKLSPNDPAVFQYSGGTTGTPKCAVGLHRNLIANVYQFDRWLVNTQAGQETVLVAIPLYHVYGMVLGMNLAVKMGAKMVLIENPRDMDGLLNAIQKHKATIFPGVPSLYAAINHYPPVVAGKFDLSSIKACISGSATLPDRVKKEFEALTKGHLVEGYGLSEAPTATHCNPILGENRTGSIGLPLPNVDCKIVDLETGTIELPVGESGELIIKGPQVMLGYHQRPEETKMAVRQGWLYTGDVARMDEDGYFYLVDRKKDVIKVGGFQVWPNEIESVILGHPKVQEVAVAGVLDEEEAEVAKAWIVLRKGETSSPEEIQTFCDPYLTPYKIPKLIEFRESLPRTGVGKVLRRVLVSEHDANL